jgi:hypothetical protein
MSILNHEESSANMNTITEESDGLPEEMSCGGHFRQCFYEDRRVYNII